MFTKTLHYTMMKYRDVLRLSQGTSTSWREGTCKKFLKYIDSILLPVDVSKIHWIAASDLSLHCVFRPFRPILRAITAPT